MLGKMVLLGLALWLVLTLLKQYRRSIDQPDQAPPVSQDMVRCSVCGVHLPKSESIERDGTFFCCAEHSQRAE